METPVAVRPERARREGKLRVAVVIPALDEEASVGQVIRAVPRDVVEEVIVVDNGSRDHTAAAAAEAGATVVRESRRGYGYACMRGIGQALCGGHSAIAFLDGDLSDYPEELPLLLRPLESEGADLVIGSRTLGKHERGALLPQAAIGNRVASLLIRLFWGYRFTDLGPFRAIRTDALLRLSMSEPTFGWTVEMQIKAAQLGMKVREVPVRYRKRIGKSKITGTLSGTLRASAGIAFTILKSVVRGSPN